MFALILAAATLTAQSAAPSEVMRVGDRIALVIEGPQPFRDTVVVREGLVLRLPNMNDISLQGVRRSELQAYLTQEIAKFVKDPVVQATPLIRVGVLGAVARPGYYSVPSDILVSDVVMVAGGPASNAVINRSVVTRADREVFNQKTVQRAMATGSTLDALGVVSGDNLVIGEKSQRTNTILQFSGLALGLVGLIIAVAQ